MTTGLDRCVLLLDSNVERKACTQTTYSSQRIAVDPEDGPLFCGLSRGSLVLLPVTQPTNSLWMVN